MSKYISDNIRSLRAALLPKCYIKLVLRHFCKNFAQFLMSVQPLSLLQSVHKPTFYLFYLNHSYNSFAYFQGNNL